MWVLLALGEGPRTIVALLDRVRTLDGPMGPGTLYAAISRLERLALIEREPGPGRLPGYQLTPRGAGSAQAFGALRGPGEWPA
jgi:DNA-binding PadR family transcriptional regulator